VLSIWVRQLRISRQVAEKIVREHRIWPQEVREAVERVSGLDFSWDYDPDRGVRVLVQVQIRGDDALVVLYPTDDPADNVWRLGSAYFTQR
jgi:hypothetical protein